MPDPTEGRPASATRPAQVRVLVDENICFLFPQIGRFRQDSVHAAITIVQTISQVSQEAAYEAASSNQTICRHIPYYTFLIIAKVTHKVTQQEFGRCIPQDAGEEFYIFSTDSIFPSLQWVQLYLLSTDTEELCQHTFDFRYIYPKPPERR